MALNLSMTAVEWEEKTSKTIDIELCRSLKHVSVICVNVNKIQKV